MIVITENKIYVITWVWITVFVYSFDSEDRLHLWKNKPGWTIIAREDVNDPKGFKEVVWAINDWIKSKKCFHLYWESHGGLTWCKDCRKTLMINNKKV